MNSPTETDIVAMLRQFVISLKGFAKANSMNLSFSSARKQLAVAYDPEEIITPIVRIICRVIDYTPRNHSLMIKSALIRESERKYLQVSFCVPKVGLLRVGEITRGVNYPIIVQDDLKGGTIFKLRWQLDKPSSLAADTAKQTQPIVPQVFPSFYTRVRRHLQSHFTNADNLISILSSYNPKDAAFLKRVNTLIQANIETEGFNANHLSALMRMSRTQLYRKLQPIIRESPGAYIKKIRIQKAKDLLETTELRVGEVAYKTGFQSHSHFTRIFIQHYGVRPSLFCRKTKM
jgi:AraC-like DNA-binding protein